MSENRLFENRLNVGRKYRNPTRCKLHIYVLFMRIVINRYIQINSSKLNFLGITLYFGTSS